MKTYSTKWTLCLILLLGVNMLFLCLASAFNTTNITIGWDPNLEDEIDGYGIYVREGSAGPPYEHVDDVFLDELSDPDAPQFKLTEIRDGTYYIAATAIDKEGNESHYSDNLCVSVSNSDASVCSSHNNSSNAATAGSGGGGCLINSAGEHFGYSEMIGLVGLIGLMGLTVVIGVKDFVNRIRRRRSASIVDGEIGWG